MSDPGAVASRSALALLVGLHLLRRSAVRLGIILHGDLRGHASHCMYPSLVARRDEQLDVVRHEGRGHGHLAAVGEDELRVRAKLLDVGENVVPATA